jgi:glycerol-3-phosphate dehydrogenase (NAD(P)+)
MKIAVLGAGAWGTALALAFSGRHAVRLWTWQAEHAAAMNAARENVEFLPGHPLPAGLTVSADAAQTLADAELAIIATPMAGLRGAVGTLANRLPFLWVCKGLEAHTGLLPH